ncbi:MAG: M17 family peptidase N-terminal domain-containing protein, partial [Terriglobales bacterium]
MNSNLSSSAPAQVETECLVAVVLDRSEKDRGEKDKPVVEVASSDTALRNAAQEVIASGEVTGKSFETTLLHHPANLKAKRLLLLGGGKAKTFSASDLRKLAGAAVRTLKGKSIRNFAFVIPETAVVAEDGVRAVVEGAFVGEFEPGYYKSDRKNNDPKIDTVTIVAQGDAKRLQSALETGRIVGEAQNFTRDLVNEPSNRMTPNILAERAR